MASKGTNQISRELDNGAEYAHCPSRHLARFGDTSASEKSGHRPDIGNRSFVTHSAHRALSNLYFHRAICTVGERLQFGPGDPPCRKLRRRSAIAPCETRRSHSKRGKHATSPEGSCPTLLPDR
jgi:hypothetical protein